MNKTAHIFLLIALCISSVQSQDRGVMVRPMNQDIFNATSDANIMALFRVTNQTSEKLEFDSQTILPSGWKLVTQEFPFEIEANSSDMRLLSFYIPKEALAGQYEVSYRANSRKYTAVSDMYSFTVNVLPVKRLKIHLLDVPAYTVAGDAYTIPFQVVNESNIDGAVTLDFNGSPSYILKPDTTQFNLSSGGTLLCSVRVQTDGSIQSMLNHFVTISARIVGDNTSVEKVNSMVKIIPRGHVKVDRYNRMPLSVGVTYATQQDGYSGEDWQFQVSGGSPLSGDQKDLLSFFFRSPDTYKKNIYTYGLHEQYSVSYRNKMIQIDLGDKSYTLSKLTEQYRWGRGAEVLMNLKDWKVGAFAHKTLRFWSGSVKQEAASYLQRSIGPNAAIGLNYLNKYSSGTWSDIFSIQGNYKLGKLAKMELEYAGAQAVGKFRHANTVAISGREKNLFYSMNWLYASPNYPGYYTNTQMYSMGFSYRFLNKLRIHVNLNQQKQQYDKQDYQVVAPIHKFNMIRLEYQWRKSTRFGLARNYRSSSDRFDQPLFDYRETGYQFSVDQGFQKLSLSGSAETGTTDNRMFSVNAGMFRLSFSAQYAPNARNSFSGYLYYDNDKRYTAVRNKRCTAGLDARSEILRGTFVELSVQNQFSPESYFDDRELFEMSLTHRIGQAQEFAIRCRKTLLHNTIDREEIAAKIDYQLKLGVPFGKNKRIGSVRGSLLDMETFKPVGNAVIRMNEYMAVTDNDGCFFFQAIPPDGVYFLSVDKTTIGHDKVLAQSTPFRVEVAGGSEKVIDLGILKGVAVKGKVTVYAVVNDTSDHFKADKMRQYLNEYYIAGSSRDKSNGKDVSVTNGKTRLIPDHGLGNVLVEIKREGEVYRRVTDNDGTFSFDGLRPGQWTLVIYDYNLPEMHKLENPVSELDLRPGNEENVLVKVLPIKRQIQFVQRGSVVFEDHQK